MLNRMTVLIAAILLSVAAVLFAYVAVTPRLAPAPVQASSAALPAQQTTSDASGIFVAGTGKVRMKPNIATTNIGVEIQAATLADATQQANAKMNAIIEKLKSLGIAEKDIQTTSYNVSPITATPRPGTTPTITGYRVNNQLHVTIRKIDDAGKTLDAVMAAGANSIDGIMFSVDDTTPYQRQARADAIKDAQDKAAQLAKAANVTLGKVISISEDNSFTPRPIFRAAVGALPASGGGGVAVETGELEISVTVEMRFAVP